MQTGSGDNDSLNEADVFKCFVQLVELLECAALLRREVEVIVSVVLVLPQPLRRQLVAPLRHIVEVVLDAWTRIKGHIHYVKRGLARLFGQQRLGYSLLC